MKQIFLGLLLLILAVPVSATDIYHKQNVIKRHVVEFDANTFLGVDGYYAIQDKAKLENARENAIDGQTLKDLVAIVKELLAKQNCPPATPGTGTEVETSPPPKVDNLDKQVYTIFAINCARCHSDAKVSGGLKLTTGQDLYDLTALQRWNVYYRVAGEHLQEFNKDLMPLNGNPLSDADVSTLKKWAVKKLLDEVK